MLNVDETSVTDAGLEHLGSLTKLSILWLNATEATDAGVEGLQQALPGLTMNR